MTKNVWLFSLSLLVTVLAYENCHRTQNELTLASCRLDLQKGFADSYHKFTKVSCGGCHNSSPSAIVPGKPFGDVNIAIAFKSFTELGEFKIRSFALDDTHQAGVTGPFNKPQIDTAQALWNTAYFKYQTCEATVLGTTPPPDPAVTIGKALQLGPPVIVNVNNPGYRAPGLQPNHFVTLSWDIGSELASGNPISGVTFSVRVALVDFGPSNDNHDYAFLISNPTLSNNSGSNIKVQNIKMQLNGVQAYDGTTFSVIDTIVGPGETRDLLVVESLTKSATMVLTLGTTLGPNYQLATIFNVLTQIN